MKLVVLLATSAIALLPGLVAAQSSRVVNIYNWSDYIDVDILTEFTEETGIVVAYDVYDASEELEAKMIAGGSGYDVVVTTAAFLGKRADVFQKLDEAKLPNLKNLDPGIATRLAVHDPGNEHAVNYMWGTTGIGVNVDMVRERLGVVDIPRSWDLVFDPDTATKLKDCGIYHKDTPEDMFPAMMIWLDREPDLSDRAGVEAAKEAFIAVQDTVHAFDSSKSLEALALGKACVAVGWSGDILYAREMADETGTGVNVEYVVPREGAEMWFDNWAIPADAQNIEEAHLFLNYMMRPDVIAKASNFVYQANGNLAASAYMDDEVLSDPAIYPDDRTMARLHAVKPYSPDDSEFLRRTWREIRSTQ